jgi:hypothetical protein
MLPPAVHNLCIGDRCPIFDKAGGLSTNVKIIVSNSAEPTTLFDKNYVGEKKEDTAPKGYSWWGDIA